MRLDSTSGFLSYQNFPVNIRFPCLKAPGYTPGTGYARCQKSYFSPLLEWFFSGGLHRCDRVRVQGQVKDWNHTELQRFSGRQCPDRLLR